ncbi:MAG: Gx transporter family protein [Wujia sp.]
MSEKQQDKKKQIYVGSSSRNSQIALQGILVALAMVLSYLESLVPVMAVAPGVKLGLANLVTMLAFEKKGIRFAAGISVTRILLSGILFGNLLVIVYSLAGAFCSLFVMAIAKKMRIFGIVGISVLGGVFHNVGQLLVAAIMLENANIFYYLVVLGISGTIAGCVIGFLTVYFVKNIKF